MNIWDTSVEVEHNPDNWTDQPKLFPRDRVVDHTKFEHIDLFSGCGGFSTGFEMSGFTTTVAIDHHPPSLATLTKNHVSCVGILGDIRKVDAPTIDSLRAPDRQLSVVTAGVPCQGFSLSNRKRHADDNRNFLFKEFIRIASHLKPDAVVLENVSGLVSTRDGEFKNAISEAIREMGYAVHVCLLNAADYGVPQLRRRVFFIGVPLNCEWIVPSRTHGTEENGYLTVGDAILGDLPWLNSGEELYEYASDPINDYQRYLRAGSPTLTNHRAPNHPDATIARISSTEPGMPMYPAFKQRIRLHPKRPSPTQVCGGIRPQFQFGHPTQARGLSIRERARIQSFPDTYFFTGGVTQGRVQTGNAVPPLLASVIASQLMKSLTKSPMTGVRNEDSQLNLF